MKSLWLLLVGVVYQVSGVLQAQSLPVFISDHLDEYVAQGMKDWNIPGLAIAIVKDGRVVVSKGYGVKDIETKEPVTENTRFLIASNSKLFTGTALAQLEYNKKLHLDDKVATYLPGFSLYDPNSTNLVTIRDLLSHRLGTQTFQGDFVFWNGNLSRSQIIQKMRLLQPKGVFRQDFGYCNSCFLSAGEIIPTVTGKPWEVYIYDSILAPLGMTNTLTLSGGVEHQQDVASPYSNQFTGKLTKVPFDRIDNIGPAGSMASNVNDMSRWLMMQLDSGHYQNQRILPWPVLQKTRDVNIVLSSRKNPNRRSNFTGYGLGLFVTDYSGRQVYWHTGGAFGFVSNTCFLPEEQLGIVILTNNDNQNFFEILRQQIIDAFLGLPFENRSAQQLPGFNRDEAATIKKVETLKQRVKGNQPPLPLSVYTGIYAHPVYGQIDIQPGSNGHTLEINFKGHDRLKATLDYMDGNDWLLTYNHIGYGIFATTFKTEKGRVIALPVKANDFIDYETYVFEKK